MKVDESFKVIGELRPLRWESARKTIAFEAVGTSDVRSARQQQSKGLPIFDQASDAQTAKAHAVISKLSPDESLPRAFSTDTLICQCYFQCSVHRFGARIGEEHVIQRVGDMFGQALGIVEYEWMPTIKVVSKVQLFELSSNGFIDVCSIVPRVHAPKSGTAI